jgi:hypothetical protein
MDSAAQKLLEAMEPISSSDEASCPLALLCQTERDNNATTPEMARSHLFSCTPRYVHRRLFVNFGVHVLPQRGWDTGYNTSTSLKTKISSCGVHPLGIDGTESGNGAE